MKTWNWQPFSSELIIQAKGALDRVCVRRAHPEEGRQIIDLYVARHVSFAEAKVTRDDKPQPESIRDDFELDFGSPVVGRRGSNRWSRRRLDGCCFGRRRKGQHFGRGCNSDLPDLNPLQACDAGDMKR